MFHFRCPHCNAKLEAEDDWAGMEAACPKCSQTITIVPETTPEKPKIQLTPITVPSSADTQRPISQPLSQPAPSSTSNKFPFICPSCGTLTDLDSSLQNQEYECPACCEKSIAVPATEKPCPHCGEMIKFQAKICRFCKKSVSEIEKRMPRQGEGVSIPSLIPATPIQLSIKELDTLFFWWWLSLALAIPTLIFRYPFLYTPIHEILKGIGTESRLIKSVVSRRRSVMGVLEISFQPLKPFPAIARGISSLE